MEVEVFVELLNNRTSGTGSLGAVPACQGCFLQPAPTAADPELAAALTEMGIRQLYLTRQRQDLIREGHNEQQYSTASGKTAIICRC